jgi:hypothetical protein
MPGRVLSADNRLTVGTVPSEARIGLRQFSNSATNVGKLRGDAMIRKGQAHQIGGRDMRAQTTSVAELFGLAA